MSEIFADNCIQIGHFVDDVIVQGAVVFFQGREDFLVKFILIVE